MINVAAIYLLEYWSNGSGGHPIWLKGVEPNICGDNIEGCSWCCGGVVCCCVDGCCGWWPGICGNNGKPVPGTIGITGCVGTPLLPKLFSDVELLFCIL